MAVKNTIGNTSGIKIRDPENNAESEVDFGQVADGATTVCAEITYSSLTGVNVNATDNGENGSVTLTAGKENLITVYEDGTEPTASVQDGQGAPGAAAIALMVGPNDPPEVTIAQPLDGTTTGATASTSSA